jgi:electron transport complex protein RnfG
MKEIIKLGLILLLISLIAAVILAFTNSATAERIQSQKDAKNEQARMDVLPMATSFEALDSEVLKGLIADYPTLSDVYTGIKDGEIVGFVIRTQPSAYGGAIEVVTGVDRAGKIMGVRIGKHAETPGLGAKATLAAFYEQYTNKLAQSVSVSKTRSSDTEIQAIAGATITSVAVTDGVNLSGNLVPLLIGQ